jgi:formate dehydrogenase subunit delta
MSPEKMVYMANQIATFFKTQPGSDQAEKVAGHIKDFWEPRMRDQLYQFAEQDAGGLDPVVLKSIELLRKNELGGSVLVKRGN